MQPNACTVRRITDEMTGKGENGKTERPERQNRLPPEILEIIQPALQVGGLSGMF